MLFWWVWEVGWGDGAEAGRGARKTLTPTLSQWAREEERVARGVGRPLDVVGWGDGAGAGWGARETLTPSLCQRAREEDPKPRG